MFPFKRSLTWVVVEAVFLDEIDSDDGLFTKILYDEERMSDFLLSR
jgi:hypothetical protein